MAGHKENKIISCWHTNARPWIEAINSNTIQSRVEITNKNIVDTVLAINPKSVLDIGCGEGWLVRELTRHGIDTLGVDIVPSLIDQANRHQLGRYTEISYDKLSSQHLCEHFDLAVANFSLLGDQSVEHVFQVVPELLHPHGHFVIQTLHPQTTNGDHRYADGWRDGSWEGFSDAFTDPAPWYFRTTENWQALFTKNGFRIILQKEPLNNDQQPASLLIVGQKNE